MDDIRTATIIPADTFISINGEGYGGCDLPVPEGEHPHAACGRHPQYGVVHAIQWFGNHGHYEHAQGPALPFTDVAVIKNYLPIWRARRAVVLREQHGHAAAELEVTTDALANLDEALPQISKQVAELDASIAETKDEKKADMLKQHKARMEREHQRSTRVREFHRARHAHLTKLAPELQERATSAEAEAGHGTRA